MDARESIRSFKKAKQKCFYFEILTLNIANTAGKITIIYIGCEI